ncbi:MAG: GGDEF domain-containing protein [Lachnospiraceae bacterium]|nr:GGDEF domain-containing protein [Lachnospiraceae bacterium]
MRKKLTIGVMIGNANAPHTKALMRSISEAAQKMDVNIIFFLSVHMKNFFREYLGSGTESYYDYQYNVVYDYVYMCDVDGLIISYGSLGEFLENKDKQVFFEKYQNLPFVLTEDYDDFRKGSSVISDNYKGMYELMEHLINAHGYRKFLLLAGPKNNRDSKEREKAFKDAVNKYNIEFADTMMQRGNYSANCTEQVAELLDAYPDAEALVCANDVMAYAAYQECERRGLVVGKDIAITGYDDDEMATIVYPPLTTVSQNEMDMGYRSVAKIVAMCNGEASEIEKVRATVKVRSSCGCKAICACEFSHVDSIEDLQTEEYIKQISLQIAHKILLEKTTAEEQAEICEQVYYIFKECTKECFSQKEISLDKVFKVLGRLLLGENSTRISVMDVTECLSEYVCHLLTKEIDVWVKKRVDEIARNIQHFIQANVLHMDYIRKEQYEQDTMFVPQISRDMLSNIDNEAEFYKAPMHILKVLHAKSAYLYVMDEPKRHMWGEEWELPKDLHLVSSLEGDEVKAYDTDNCKALSRDNRFSFARKSEDAKALMCLNLFVGEEQFGILMVEMKTSEMLLVHLASMQISGALSFYFLYRQQLTMKADLAKLVDEIQQKNTILAFISKTDQMTGTFNRNGFMEEALKFVRMMQDKEALMFMVDVDRLKEINDCFGHMEGDYAIQTSAEILKEVLGKEALIARIGGDEFVAILPKDESVKCEDYTDKISEKCKQENTINGKPYYVEMSVGVIEFVCSPQENFNELFNIADKELYKQKQGRRGSIRKMS